jgi:predicted anti-sigma-YlaC factor YlaD
MPLKPTCREVHQLTSESLDRRLTLRERVRVRLHLMVCEACTAFGAQMQLLRRAMVRFEIPVALPPNDPP